MRRFILILIFLCNPLYAVELVVTSTPTPIQRNILAAKTAWAALPNKADPLFLDHFIATYPQSDEAQIGFTLRFNGVQTSRSIPHYQAFIDKYASTLAAEQAIYELFELYHQQNTIAGYFEFIQRYPNSLQAMLAKLHLEALVFEATSQLDAVIQYDNFIAMFPTAVQVPAAEKLAQQKALLIEESALNTERESLKNRLTEKQQQRNRLFKECLEKNSNSCRKKLGELEQDITRFKEEIEQIVEKRANRLATKMEKVGTAIKKANKDKALYSQRLVRRYCHLLLNAYSDREAAQRCRVEQRHDESLKQLQALLQMIENSNVALIEALKTEFAKTYHMLREGFERLHLDNLAWTKTFEALNPIFVQVQQDFIKVNRNLIKIHQGLTNVQATLAQSHVHLMLLHEDLKLLHNRLVQLNRDRNKGMEKQKSLLRDAASTVKQGFSVLHADLEASQLQATKLKQEKLALANRQLFSEQPIAKELEKTHQQHATQTKQLRKTLGSIIEAQQWSVKAIEHQTKVMIYNTDQLLAAEQETRKLMNQFIRQFIDEIKLGKGCGDKDTDEIVPDEWGDADFYLACQKHDDCYDTCGKTQKFCDDAFSRNLKQECHSLDLGETPCLKLAKVYHWAVTKKGDEAWKEAQEYCYIF